MIKMNDNTMDSKVKVGIGFNNDIQGIDICLYPHKEVVYTDARNKTILYPPSEINLQFSLKSLRLLTEALIEHSSMYFIGEKETKQKIITTSDRKYTVTIKKDISKSKAKAIFSVQDENKELIIELKLHKNKIFIFLDWIKTIFSENVNSFRFPLELENGYILEMGRNTNRLFTVRGIALLQKDMDIIRYLVDEIIFSFKIDKTFQGRLQYSQVDILQSDYPKSLIVIFKNKQKNKKELHFNITPRTLAALYLSVPFETPAQRESVEALGDKPSIITSRSGVIIGFENKQEKYSFKNKKGGIRMHLFDTKTQSKLLVDLAHHWNRIISTLLEIYDGDLSIYNDDGGFTRSFSFLTVQDDGTVMNSELRILTRNKEESNTHIVIRSRKGSSIKKEDIEYKINLTRPALMALINRMLSVARNTEGYSFSFYHHEKKVKLSLSASKNKRIKVYENNSKMELCDSDCALLLSSAKYRIKTGRWLAFQGEDITVSDDGYLTTLKEEYQMEKKGLAQKIAVSCVVLYRGEHENDN